MIIISRRWQHDVLLGRLRRNEAIEIEAVFGRMGTKNIWFGSPLSLRVHFYRKGKCPTQSMRTRSPFFRMIEIFSQLTMFLSRCCCIGFPVLSMATLLLKCE